MGCRGCGSGWARCVCVVRVVGEELGVQWIVVLPTIRSANMLFHVDILTKDPLKNEHTTCTCTSTDTQLPPI